MTRWRIPPEVVEEVFDRCAEGPQPDYKTLTALTLVCWRLCLRAKRNLLQHVVVSSPAQAWALLNNADISPHLAESIMHLTVSAGVGQYLPLALLGRLARNLKTVTLSVDLEGFCPKYFVNLVEFPNVCNLELKGMCLRDVPHLRRLVRAFPQVRCLTLDDVGFQRLVPRPGVSCHASPPWVPAEMSSIYIQASPRTSPPGERYDLIETASHSAIPQSSSYKSSVSPPTRNLRR
ncbi:hypothetical protein C8Q78DRAFT_133301 [Trametes maxima]|nr:hypothetical protein C8Q78DRAFT_133301 [Trametes maxima]